jgi:tetratricopeptide (TPR) repeat protein
VADAPFPGPRSFVLGERSRFFGRAKETRDLTDLVLAYPLVVLSAQSGAGKTSIIHAGLAPRAAADEGALLLFSRVSGRVPPDRLADIKNVFIYNCLSGLQRADGTCAHASPTAVECQGLAEGMLAALRALDLCGVVPAQTPPGTMHLRQPVILVIDQFEEIFTTHQERWSDRKTFFKQLAGLLATLTDLHVLLALRDDYVAEIDPFGGMLPGGLRVRYRLERLRQEQALEAVTKPLELREYDCRLRTPIATAIVRDLLQTNVVRTPGVPNTGPIEGEFVEPVHLQVVCGNLWDAMQKAKPLPAAEAEAVARDETLLKNERELIFSRGEVWFRAESATVNDVDRALRGMYDQAIRLACKEWRGGERRLRRLVAQELITVGGTRGFIDAATAKCKGVPARALEVLEEARILRREPRAGAPWYEITHDRFLVPISTSNQTWSDRQRRPWQIMAMVGLLIVIIATGAVAWKFRVEKDDVQIAAQKAVAGAERKVKQANKVATNANQWAEQAQREVSAQVWEESLLAQAVANAESVQDLKKLQQAIGVARPRPPAPAADHKSRQMARRLWNVGYESYLAGKSDRAQQKYEAAIDADPSYAPAYNSLGVIKHNNLDLDSAAQLYEKAIARDPGYLPVLVNYANLELMRKDAGKASELARRALALRPNYRPAKRILANAATHLKKSAD